MCPRRITSTLLACGVLCVPALASPPAAVSVSSPDGRLTLTLDLRAWEGERGVPVYTVLRDGEVLVAPSRLGLVVGEGLSEGAALDPTAFGRGLELASHATSTHDATWQPVYGERSVVRDHYRSLTVELRHPGPVPRRLGVEIRAFDEGIAFSYSIPAQEGLAAVRVESERTEFRFRADHRAWAVYSAQGKYQATTLAGIRDGCERPLVLQAEGGPYLAIGEARLVDFARMKLGPLDEATHALAAQLDGPSACPLPFRSPWRVLLVADSPGELLERNDLFLNLNDPCALEDTSWIRPGKVLREITLTTAGGRACVDFAAAHGLQYVEFDAGWYGNEYDEASDATTVSVDPKRSPGPLDLPGVIRYARERGIGILLYVNRRALERQLDEILPLFRAWGVQGVKYGFVNVGSQRWTAWLHGAVRKAAAHRLMVDVHDEYRPTGYSRTWPNLMTQEGIAGDETSPSNEQTLTILFTRMLAGAGDNTICYFDERVAKNATHAYQLAKAVCLYSPWQFLFWYDRPPESPGGGKNVIGDEPELEFLAAVPTVWDDTIVLEGEIGAYAAIARRSGEEWYIGCMNGAAPRSCRIPLVFLAQRRRYTASSYYDDPAVNTRTHVAVARGEVDATTTLEFSLLARGGRAVRIVPRNGVP